MKKLLQYMIIMTTLLSCFFTSVKADDTADYDKGSYAVHATFDEFTTRQSTTWDFEYNDKWFYQDAAVYNHKLARLTFGMAVSAFRPHFDPKTSQDPGLHLRDFLVQCGFRKLRSDDYDKNPSLYTVSTVIGHKPLWDDDGEFVLIAVGVCGGGYTNEWLSNLTCGDGDLHEGFNSAASEVYDRVFGYIAENGLSNKRFKIWIGGYSRAAAISNILGAKMIDSQVFANENVFCYTFATPRTTKNTKNLYYYNIYNIVGKMDPVPQVPFADWGYDRFGVTLYLPCQETDSDYGQKAALANIPFKKATGLEFWNNVEWNTKLRVILNYLLKIAPTSEIYRDHLQQGVINIMENKSVPNIMTQLVQIASDSELINDENQSEANSLLTYLAYTMYGYLTSADIDARYRKQEASTIGNLAHEHTQDVYLAWLYSADNAYDLYSGNLDYLRVVISGNVDTGVFYYDDDLGFAKAVNSDGSFPDSFNLTKGYIYRRSEQSPDIFMERRGSETIILLPKDRDYRIVIKSNASQRVEFHSIALKVGYTNGNFSRLYYLDMVEGQTSGVTSTVFSETGGEIVAGDTFDSVDVSYNSSTDFILSLEKSNFLNLNWRQIVILAYMLPILIICLIGLSATWLTSYHRFKRRKQRGQIDPSERFDRIPAALMYSVVALFLLQELLYWLMPVYLIQRSLLKILIGLCSLVLCYRLYRRQPTQLSKAILMALAICCVADVTVNYTLERGMYLFAIAQILLCYYFYRFDKPEKWQIAFWVITTIISGILIVTYGSQLSYMYVSMILYMGVLMFLTSLSLTMPKKIRTGTILLVISNVLLFFNEVGSPSLISHVLSLGIYYGAIMLFAFAARYSPHNVQQQEKKPEEKEPDRIIAAG